MESRFELTPFLDRIASEHVGPAGGSAAAAVGAIGVSLAEMAAIHTLQSGETDHEAQPQLAAANRSLTADRSLLAGLMDADARVVESAFGSFSSELDVRRRKQLVGVPLAIAEVCLDVLSESKDLVSIATRSVTQDLRTAITLVTAAVKASLETAEHNLDLLDGPARDRLADRVGDAADWATVLTDSSQGSGK
jgi:formiminotetrahydrofolate cyclodeaminase